jgi:small subunit ribosomal protein S1
VLGRVKGGLAVDVGITRVHARLAGRSAPGTQPRFAGGPGHSGKIIKLNRRRGNVVVSRKTRWKKRSTSEVGHARTPRRGSVVTGVVKNLTDYGAFIDLGGIDGLLHRHRHVYGRITHPSEMLPCRR